MTGRRRFLVRAILAAVVLWLGACSVLLGLAAVDAQRGNSQISAARSALGTEQPVDSGVIRPLREAQASFQRAESRARSPLLLPLRVVPVVGRQVTTFTAMAGAAERVSDVAAGTTEKITALTASGSRKAQDRPQMAKALGRIAEEAHERLKGVDAGPTTWLVSPLRAKREDFAAEFTSFRQTLSRASAAGSALSDMLEGPRTYLVLGANNAEMRAGSGMFLSAGTMLVQDGRLQLGEMEPTAELRVPDGVKVDRDFRELWGWLHPERDMRNLALTPRFDASAQAAAEMWEALGNPKVDGVFAVDPVALQALLRSTGPVQADGRSISADEAVQDVLHDQYIGVTDVEKPIRRDRLSQLAQAAMGALDEGDWEVESLMRELAGAASGRHILAWSTHEKEQQLWESAGVAGTLGADDLMVSVLNRGGNKLDQFLKISAVLERGDGDEATLRVSLANEAKPGEPVYIEGPHPNSGAKAGQYVGILTVSLPGAARNARFDGVKRLAVGGADGDSIVVGTEVSLKRGQEESYLLRFELAPGPLTLLPSARFPGVDWRLGSHDFPDLRSDLQMF